MRKTAFKKFALKCLCRPYPFKIFKGCLPQILLGPFLSTLSHIKLKKNFLLIFSNIIWLLFPEMRVARKIFTGRPQIYFFKSIFRWYSLFFFSFLFLFCILVFFYLFACFLKLKYIYSDTHSTMQEGEW